MSLTQQIKLPAPNSSRIKLFMRREDLNHPGISGNKYRKLKYNIQAARKQKTSMLLTFGGAYSNHIAAVAFAGSQNGFKTVGIIRGEELQTRWHANPTLSLAHNLGMRFKFVSRETYKERTSEYLHNQLREEFGPYYYLPEGGTNKLAVKGCEEILQPGDEQYDLICCAVGTGGTLAGISNSLQDHQRILGFSAVADHTLQKHIRKFATVKNWKLNYDYLFGGYAKVNLELIQFINQFKLDNRIQLDPVYMGKMMFGLNHLLQTGDLGHDLKVLAIHSGGQQGIAGMNTELKRKKLPLINV